MGDLIEYDKSSKVAHSIELYSVTSLMDSGIRNCSCTFKLVLFSKQLYKDKDMPPFPTKVVNASSNNVGATSSINNQREQLPLALNFCFTNTRPIYIITFRIIMQLCQIST